MVKHIGLLVADWDDQQQSPNIFPNISRLLREKSCKILNPGRWSRFRVRIRYTIYSAKRTCVFKRFSSIRSETAHSIGCLIWDMWQKFSIYLENYFRELKTFIPNKWTMKFQEYIWQNTRTDYFVLPRRSFASLQSSVHANTLGTRLHGNYFVTSFWRMLFCISCNTGCIVSTPGSGCSKIVFLRMKTGGGGHLNNTTKKSIYTYCETATFILERSLLILFSVLFRKSRKYIIMYCSIWMRSKTPNHFQNYWSVAYFFRNKI